MSMPIRLLPVVTGLLPLIAIHVSYLIAIQAQRVPACIPYLEGCTSVSATGRYPPASFLFKSTMLPGAVLLLLFWICTNAWLRALESQSTTPRVAASPYIAWLGGGGAIALIIYVIFLGTHQPFYEFMRRFGIYFFFLLTILAQLDMSFRLKEHAISVNDRSLNGLAQRLLILAVLPFLLGALNLVLKSVLSDPDRSENIIEWIVVVMIQAHIIMTYFAWRDTGFAVKKSVTK